MNCQVRRRTPPHPGQLALHFKSMQQHPMDGRAPLALAGRYCLEISLLLLGPGMPPSAEHYVMAVPADRACA